MRDAYADSTIEARRKWRYKKRRERATLRKLKKYLAYGGELKSEQHNSLLKRLYSALAEIESAFEYHKNINWKGEEK